MNSTILKQSDCMMSVGMASVIDSLYNRFFNYYYVNAMLSRESTVLNKITKSCYFKKPIKITVAKSLYCEGYKAKDSTILKISELIESLNGKFEIEIEKLNIPGASETLLEAKGNDILSTRTVITVKWV